MARLKRAEETSSNRNLPMSSSDAATDFNFLDDDWVIVKKQKVNILIPPLPGSSHPVACNPASDQLQDAAVSRELVNAASAEKGSEERLVLVNDKPSSNPQMRGAVLRVHKSNGIQHGLRAVKQRRLSPRKFNLNDGPTMLSKMMKASNLERKLLRAGGLSRWLSSLGLEQYVRIFHERRISKFQLVSMSMRKLKDMGIHEVGPRRKLIHAIECVCHPYCFEAL